MMIFEDTITSGIAIAVLALMLIIFVFGSPLLTPSLSDRTYRAQIRSRNERLDVLAKVLPEDLCSGKEQELFEQVVDGIVEIVEVGGP